LIRNLIEVVIALCLEDFFIVVFIVLCSNAFLYFFDFNIDNNKDNNENSNKDIYKDNKDVIYNVKLLKKTNKKHLAHK